MAAAKQLMVYPANRLEDLAVLLNHVLKLGQQNNAFGVLSSPQVIVDNTGMQHWLNTQLAIQNGIAMNIDYPLPGKFVWQLARQMLGDVQVPQQPPYQREALVWRIDDLLASDTILMNPVFAEANRYWQSEQADVTGDLLKRFQLASALADLFEQYILYRPDWLTQWQQHSHTHTHTQSNGADHWQAQLWAILCQQDGRHPIDIQKKLIQSLAKVDGSKQRSLPTQICLFALNTMAPATLDVFSALAQHTQVHVFHLNPCAEYWGHIQSEKAIAATHLKQWMAQQDDTMLVDGGNPLLANLGSQGKEFFRLLQQQDSYNIDAFEEAQPASREQQLSVLQQLQQDVLHLEDARESEQYQVDDSLVFTHASSALRELQGLHDWLLGQFQQDPSLKPSDVLVMCPQVEDYAAYVGAVFDTHSRQFGAWHAKAAAATPQLPCSIADRKPQDSEPLVAAYLQLLQLPDSRFTVSSILDLLRLPAMQRKFGIAPEELDTIAVWLANACVHWGLDGPHKANTLGQDQASSTHSWSWGLRRLLLGFAQGGDTLKYQDDWLLADVEGGQAVLLGRLMQVLNKLQDHAKNLNKARTGAAWKAYLIAMIDEFFAQGQGLERNEEQAKECLSTAIGNMTMWVEQVAYSQPISLEVVRYSLTQKLSVASSSQAFITGQITFCSMVPMRSIPFKVVALLGLNDGQYPRQAKPFDFDLMAQEERRVGDRSRRGDDRYLFLEAIISARSCLYLSYQGVDAKNNSPRQPSLILSELMDYLNRGYGWNFDPKSPASKLTQLPLHSFSEDNFSAARSSFETSWLRLLQSVAEPEEQAITPPITPLNSTKAITISELVRFLENPGRTFATQTLGLYLHRYELGLEDDEPFSNSKLVEYKLREQMLGAMLSNDPQAIEVVTEEYQLSGKLPDNHLANVAIETSQDQSQTLVEQLQQFNYSQVNKYPVSVCIAGFTIEDQLPLLGNPAIEDCSLKAILSRPSTAKTKDGLTLWLTCLVAQVAFQRPVSGVAVHLEKNLELDNIDHALEQLQIIVELYSRGLTQALPLDAELGQELLKIDQQDTAKRLNKWHKKWHHHKYSKSFDFASDPYRRWLWPQTPHLNDWEAQFSQLYQPMVDAIKVVKHA
ncbi:MAG: exodeoxyribonuclease V subunit gamma [Gammaproteobacteria bacterium]|nr:exodeoxyribonuclease V subunit gamma [Gammaproteobacteria bacterium]